MSTIQKTFKMSVKTKQNYYISKDILMKKKINILSSEKIKYPLDKNNYLNIDIPYSSLLLNKPNKINKIEDYIITFHDFNSLFFVKDYMKHPYNISTVKISDIYYYIMKSKNNLMILGEYDYDINSSGQIYNALIIQNNKMIKSEYIPISSIEFRFDKE